MTNSDVLHKLKRIDEILLEIRSITTCDTVTELCVDGIDEVSDLVEWIYPAVADDVRKNG